MHWSRQIPAYYPIDLKRFLCFIQFRNFLHQRLNKKVRTKGNKLNVDKECCVGFTLTDCIRPANSFSQRNKILQINLVKKLTHNAFKKKLQRRRFSFFF